MTGNGGADTLIGGAGIDTASYGGSVAGIAVDLGQCLASGGDANGDVLIGIENLVGSAYADVLSGDAGTNTLTGGAGNDTLSGAGGDDSLDGGTGNDTLIGGLGNDTFFVDSASDVVVENAAEGTDIIRVTAAGYTLAANVENMLYTGTGAFIGTGNALANTLTGSSGADTLSGADGDDTLDGGSGGDRLVGGLGNDTFVVDNASDTVVESAGEGADTVRTTLASCTLAANVENLTYTGSSTFVGTGNTVDNFILGGAAIDTLTGGAGNDTLSGAGGGDSLDGGTGNDTLIGGLGNDTFFVDSAGDVVVEKAGEGTDIIRVTAASYTLAANVENMLYTGTGAFIGTGNALANTLTGSSGADTLSGADGDDTLDGGVGADTLAGGLGNDTFIIDNAGDTAVENASEGTDVVRTSLASYTLSANVENMLYTGTGAFVGTGNALANTLTGRTGADTLSGGDGDDTLDGGTGADRLLGGLGNDTFIVDNASDVVVENAGEGIDIVRTTLASYTLATNVENLTYAGSSVFTGTGNASDNIILGSTANDTLTGAAGNDTLDGGSGLDRLVGGLGDDVYVVDNAGDVVVENASEGTETVRTTLASYTLSSNVENLINLGSGAFIGTGNTLANVLTGGSGADTLNGSSGNDTLDGGAGSDSLVGGTGVDIYNLGIGSGSDIVDNTGAAADGDTVAFGAGIAQDQLWFRHVGNDLEVSVIGTNDRVTVKGWYAASTNHVSKFTTNGGKTVVDTQVENLVTAMAGMTAPPLGQIQLTSDQHQLLDGVIAANWA